ncbi:MAG: transporter permease, partial [Oerskovia sp.]|nr:transporter permease [Oerskovia sp.]
MSTHAATTTPGVSGRPPSAATLTWIHLKYQFLETVRVPIAVLGNLLFPALAMFFFVVPQKEVAGDPVAATTAVASLGLFA